MKACNEKSIIVSLVFVGIFSLSSPVFSFEKNHYEPRNKNIEMIKKELAKCNLITYQKERMECQASVRNNFMEKVKGDSQRKLKDIETSKRIQKPIQDGRKVYDESKGKHLRW